MNEIADVTKGVWAAIAAIELFLVVSLVRRRDVRKYPAFFLYICCDLVLSAGMLIIYGKWGYATYRTWLLVWSLQLLVVVARSFVIAQICHQLFGYYRGIWELIRRILLITAAAVLLYALISARANWLLIMPNIQRALELAMATVLVGLFLFARYYDVQAPPDLGALALGFLLFSCFVVLNVTVLNQFKNKFAPLWTLLQMVAFLASAILWTRALWQTHAARAHQSMLSSSDIYRTLTPAVNMKLRHLNEQLSQFLKVEADRP